MGKTCCMYGCKSNYRTERRDRDENGKEPISVYRFPSKKNNAERQRWIDVVKKINANLEVGDETVICSRHWPENCTKKRHYGKERPVDPPSIFSDIPASIVPPPPPPLRTTTRTSCHERNRQDDELNAFYQLDTLTFESMKEELTNNSRNFLVPFNTFVNEDALYLQSTTFADGVPVFLIKIFSDLRYETFHLGVKVYVTSLSKNRVSKLDKWSRLEEALRFLILREADQKQKVLQEQFQAMHVTPIGQKVFSPAIIIRAFEYFCTSRALYSKLQEDYALPSIRTLTRITSKVGKLEEGRFLKKVFQNITENQKLCIVMFDEIYVKMAMLFHGGRIFGKAADDPSKLARTVLGIMVVCLYGGPKFLTKMLPVANLNAEFVQAEINETMEAIIAANGEVKILVCDGNRVNQRYFKMFSTVPSKPWLTEGGLFLLFDFVHLIKSLRNNWLTEKTKEILFYENGVAKIAKWSNLVTLYRLESSCIIKLSKLNEVAISPKPIERQKVSTCLRVFCEETVTALLTHPGMSNVEGRKDTAAFIKLVVNFWKIVNVKALGADIRHNDPLQAAVCDPEDERLKFLSSFGDMALKMKATSNKTRVRQLTTDTANAMHQTCHGIVDLCKDLLSTSHIYVCIGKFTSDFIEKEYSKLRQGSGGTYFITVQQILEKVNMKNTSLLLSLNLDLDTLDVLPGHQCSSCNYNLTEEAIEIFDNLEALEDSLAIDTKMGLVHIAGYVTRNDPDMSDEELFGVTTFYYEKFGGYTDQLDRGQLNVPTDSTVQWSFFSFIIFHCVKDSICKISLSKIFSRISEHYKFGMKSHHSRILSNVFIKNYCLESTPRTSKETSLKVLKLS